MNWNNVSLRRPALKNADPGEKIIGKVVRPVI